jgi:hypothetical protein
MAHWYITQLSHVFWLLNPTYLGVTMVGIHERSAREKIFSNQVARKQTSPLSPFSFVLSYFFCRRIKRRNSTQMDPVD